MWTQHIFHAISTILGGNDVDSTWIHHCVDFNDSLNCGTFVKLTRIGCDVGILGLSSVFYKVSFRLFLKLF